MVSRPYYAPIGESQITKDYLKVLRTGKPANWQAQADAGDWHESMQDPDFAQSFTDLMNCRGPRIRTGTSQVAHAIT